jgi:hypothetical protein
MVGDSVHHQLDFFPLEGEDVRMVGQTRPEGVTSGASCQNLNHTAPLPSKSAASTPSGTRAR